jgi:hypothetical protein
VIDVPIPDRPSITFIFREDYIAHPREKDGKRRNKIENELELLTLAKSAYHLRSLSFSIFVNIFSNTLRGPDLPYGSANYCWSRS